MKKAIVVVSFGTTYKETRERTIEACEKKMREGLEDYDFFRSFTSNRIIKVLRDREKIHIETPIEVLDRLHIEGYKEVIVQTLHIIPGEEFNKLKREVQGYSDKFEKIILGRPLLTYKEDYDEVIKAIKCKIPKKKDNEAVVFMAHGTKGKSSLVYTKLEAMLRKSGINAYIGTIQEDKKLEQIIKRLKYNDICTVNLIPFMLVAGYHVINDMIGEHENSWKYIFESYGFEVKAYLEGLGENPNIQEKFMKHTSDCINNKTTKVGWGIVTSKGD